MCKQCIMPVILYKMSFKCVVCTVYRVDKCVVCTVFTFNIRYLTETESFSL